MSKLIAALIAGLFCLSVAQAQDKKPADNSAPPAAEKKMSAQQSKMGNCSKEARTKNLKGDARKQFMRDCLKGGSATAATPAAEKKMGAQRSKMGNCSKEAKAKKLKGDERKKFMSACLKG